MHPSHPRNRPQPKNFRLRALALGPSAADTSMGAAPRHASTRSPPAGGSTSHPQREETQTTNQPISGRPPPPLPRHPTTRVEPISGPERTGPNRPERPESAREFDPPRRGHLSCDALEIGQLQVFFHARQRCHAKGPLVRRKVGFSHNGRTGLRASPKVTS